MSSTDPTTQTNVGLLDVEETRARETVLRKGHGADDSPYPRGTFRRPISGMITLVAAIIATYIVPPLSFARPWTSEDPVLFWNLLGRGPWAQTEESEEDRGQVERAQALAQLDAAHEPQPLVDKEVVVAPPQEAGVPPYTAHADDAQATPHPLELPHPSALDSYFARLTRSDLGFAGQITRAVHWGDSVIANDNVTSTLRELMQARFGDSGHGFHLIAKPNASYRHRAIRFSDGEAWSRCYIINGCKSDGHYGLGGTTVWSSGGARSKFGTATDARNGQKMSRLEVWYAAEPRGGNVRVTLDGEHHVLQTTAEDGQTGIEDRVERYLLEDGPHEFELRAAGGGRVRLYGVVVERDVPGVVWDGMAQLGAFSSRMLNFDPTHIHRQIELRDPALLVFEFGGNDLLLKASQLVRYEEQYEQMIERFRGEAPPSGEPDERLPCLVISPVDHGQRTGARIESVPMMTAITDTQRRVANRQGCAFFDTWAAMGGKNAVARWRKAHPPLISGDLAHLTHAGQRALGTMIYLALMQQYKAYRGRIEGQPFAVLGDGAQPGSMEKPPMIGTE